MAYLPPGMAEATAEAKASRGYERAADGDYTFLIRDVSYEEITTKKGVKEKALIIRRRVVESRPHPHGQPDGVKPNAVGVDVDDFFPDWGDAKQMLPKKLKAFVLGVLGLDEKAVPKEKLVKAIEEICGPQQMARGMLVRGVTFRTKKDDGDEFMGFNYHPVIGENIADAPAVLARREEIEREMSSDVQTSVPAGSGSTSSAASSTQRSQSTVSETPPPPPGEDPPAPPPAADPMEGWKLNPGTADRAPDQQWYYRPDKKFKGQYKKSEIIAGKFTREG